MAYQKLKKEEYRNAGGINQKASVYVTGEREVLDLINYDLQTIGAWSQRPGMTTALAGNTLAVGASNRFNFGFQTYKCIYVGGGITFTQANYLQSNSLVYSLSLSNGVLSVPTGSTLAYTPGFGNATSVVASVTLGVNSYVNSSFYTSGKNTFKANPDGVYYYGLPPYGDGQLLVTNASFSTSGTGSLSGVYTFSFAYQDYTGYVGALALAATGFVAAGASNILVSNVTFTQKALLSGATAVRVYAKRVAGYSVDQYVSVGSISASSLTLNVIGLSGGQLQTVPTDGLDPYQTRSVSDYVPNTPYVTTSLNADFDLSQADCVEFFGNRLFWGLSQGLNIIYYSDPIQYEYESQNVEPDSFLLVKSENYPLVGLKSYNQSLLTFFQKGVGRITGDNASNFNYQQLTFEYGVVSSRSIVVFQDLLWFIDEYQIIEFSGSNFRTISNPVTGYISRMNVAAAQKTATAHHWEDRNEVWFAIPIDGSNENNIILVYDYNALGWYVIKSTSNFTALQMFSDQTLVQGQTLSTVFMNNERMFTGHPGGSLGCFGATFKTDYGNAITLSYKTRYHCEQGPSTTMEWRRFYLDTGAWAGVTLSFSTNFYANFATATISLTRTIYASGSAYSGPQQSRIDFGIPAKSLSVESHVSTGASIPIIRIYGYTIESRFLRSV